MGNTVGSRLTIDSREKEVILGTLLGDAHARMLKTDARLEIGHSEAQKDYVYWKYQELKQRVRAQPQCSTIYDPRYNKHHIQWRFRTRINPLFTEFRLLFYPAGKKIIPSNISSLLTSPLSLAVLFMDDGGRRNDCYGLFLNTLSFTKSEHETLQQCLRENFSLETRMHWIQDGYRLYISSKEAKKFCEIVYPHLIPSMYYKLSYDPVTTSFARLDRARDRRTKNLL